MKKISEHRAGFFKRRLSMLLIMVLLVSNLTGGSAAAGVTDVPTGDTAETAAEEAAAETAGTEDNTGAEETGGTTEETTPGENTDEGETGGATEGTKPGENTDKGETGGATEETKPGETTGTEETKPGDSTDPDAGDTSEDPAVGDETADVPEEDVSADDPVVEEPVALFAADVSGGDPEVQPTGNSRIDFGDYTISGLDIYNNLYYSDSSNSDPKRGNGGYVITGTNMGSEEGKTGQPIVIGNHPIDGKTDTNPLDQDIFVFLKDLNMDSSITIKPVGTNINTNEPPAKEDGYGVVMAVMGDEDAENPEEPLPSSIGALIVEKNAKLTLTVDEPLTVTGNIELQENSGIKLILNADLTVMGDISIAGDKSWIEVSTKEKSGSGSLIVSGAITSEGDVALNSGTVQAKQGISAKTLSLNGGTVQVVKQGISAETLSLKDTEVSAGGMDITAKKALSMENSKVSNAGLFGYGDGVTGAQTLILKGKNTFSNVKAVGCKPDSKIKLSIDETEIGTVTSEGDTHYYRDYTITYPDSLEAGVKAVPERKDWAVAYRVSSSDGLFKNAVIEGYHVNPDSITNPGSENFVYTKIKDGENKEISLPELSKKGYEYQGWTPEGSEKPVKSITIADGDIKLAPSWMAERVTLKMDRGYDPDQYTNDEEDGKLPDRNSVIETEVGKKEPLPVPTRFGYIFKGWKYTVDGAETTISKATDKEFAYTVNLDDCVDEDGKHVVSMEAQWEADQFQLVLFLGTSVTGNDKLMISIDEGKNFQSFEDFTKKYDKKNGLSISLDQRNIYFPTGQMITYGESVSGYMKKFFDEMTPGTLPDLKDDNTAGTTQSFAGWSSIFGGAVDKDTKFLYGENGMLSPGGKKLTEFQKNLKEHPASILAAWGKMSYALILPDTMPAGWELSYIDSNGEEKKIEAKTSAGTIQVREDTQVTLTTSAVTPENFTLWGFTREATGEKFSPDPKEQKYSPGDQRLKYVFTMPSANVKATYGNDDIWIDIARSPIVFDEEVDYNGRIRKGFWYADTIDELTPLFMDENKKLDGTKRDGTTLLSKGTYFYQWDFADTFRVTSKEKGAPTEEAPTPTQNQLTLVNALTGGVYFRDLDLKMRDSYAKNTDGSLIGGVDCEITNDGPISADKAAAQLKENKVNLADYANIIIDNNSRQAYATTLYFVGENNTVGAIMPDALRPDENHKNTLNIAGSPNKDNSALNLGTAFGNFSYAIKDIKVNEYLKEGELAGKDLRYLIHSSNWGCSISNAEIQAAQKTLHVGNSSSSISNSNVDLLSINAYTGVGMYNSSYLRIRKNLLLGYVPITLRKNSKVVIDGNLEMNYQHWSTGGEDKQDDKKYMTDETDNWLIVKGNRCDLTNFNWRSGTLICNALIFGRCGGISGGTVITNQILSQPVGFWKYDAKAHEYNHAAENTTQTEKATQNGDNYPFTVYSQKRDGLETYSFSGGNIYLLGHYKATNGKYDSEVTAQDTDNPVAEFITAVLDNEGGLSADAVGAALETNAENAVKTSTRTDKECVVLGNSTYNTGTCSRSIKISGANIYAAGNLTFFNDTTVSGGSVYCNGSFGTKGDLAIESGSMVTATTVGNAYNLKTVLTDGTVRWRLTEIKGGTVNADRIGAFETCASNSALEPKSTVTVSDGAVLSNKAADAGAAPEIVHDVYINYIFSQSLFKNDGTPTNPDTMRFRADWESGKTFGEQAWNNSQQSFTPPTVVGGGLGSWKWDSMSGAEVDSISANGYPQKDGSNLGSTDAFDRIQMKLYAVKQTYDLIFKLGADKIEGVTCANAEVTLPNPMADGKKVAVTAEKQIVVKLNDPSMVENHTVLWYIDGVGAIHNVTDNSNNKVGGTRNGADGTITFTMPTADVEVYVTNDLPLDLDQASYTLLQDGFWTESGEEVGREDAKFHYWGNLTIHQGTINKMSFTSNNASNSITVNYGAKSETETTLNMSDDNNKINKVYSTSNNIRVKAGFNNIEKKDGNIARDRTVTLHNIYQYGDSYSTGIYLEDAAKANFTLDGPIKICRVHVPAEADFSLNGKNGAETDAFYPYILGQDGSRNGVSLGNFYGAAGDITLGNLTILGTTNGTSGGFCYGASKVDDKAVKGANTVRFENCQFTTSNHWYSGSYLAYNAKEVIIDNSKFTVNRAKSWPSPFFEKCDDVTIRNGSDITIMNSGSSSSRTVPFYYGISNKLLIDSATVSLFMREPTEDDENREKYQTSQSVNEIANVIELTGNASLTLDQHARLKKLIVGGSSTANVGKDKKGYLLCQDIEVKDTAALNAGGIIVSGFYDASHVTDGDTAKELQREEDFGTEMAAGRDIYDGSKGEGLVVNGGTVTVTEYITGDVNGKITVNGGTVNAPVIGTTGKLYGYTRYVPIPGKGEKYIYTYDKIPEKDAVTVTVTNGEVQVGEYLGGMHAKVNISGGKVALGENAVLGLTDQQRDTLLIEASSHGEAPADFGSLTITGGLVESAVENADGLPTGGSIRMPYGKVDVSGENTGIKVYDMTAEYGEITISGLKGKKYENPYTGSDKFKDHEKPSLVVSNLLSAMNLTITEESVVYANFAYADVPKGQTGNLTVTVEGAGRAYLYAGTAYGVIGEGEGKDEYNDGTSGADDKNVIGSSVVHVQYCLLPTDNAFLPEDRNREITNPNLNKDTGLPNYVVVADDAPEEEKSYTLKAPSCLGYDFVGWYECDPETQTLIDPEKRVTEIDKTGKKDICLGAKWERTKIEFEIRIEVSEKEKNDSMELVGPGTDGKNVYRFTTIASVPYGARILAPEEGGIRLYNYTTKTKGIQELAYGKEILTPNSTVRLDMVEAYLSDKNSKKPLILTVKGPIDVRTEITLHQNKATKEGKDHTYPRKASFNLNLSAGVFTEEDNTRDTVSSLADFRDGATFEKIPSFVNKEGDKIVGLIAPTADGYTFDGWYTNEEGKGNKLEVTQKLEELHTAGTTDIYAKWMPNTYIVQFNAKTREEAKDGAEAFTGSQWVTEDGDTVPAAGSSGNEFLNYRWKYDAAPNEGGDGFKLAGGSAQKVLPSAWREGYVFDGWIFMNAEGKEQKLTDGDELSNILMAELDVNTYIEKDGDNAPAALTLYASYHQVTVTYNLDGGKWMTKDENGKVTEPTANPKYGDALAGYKKESDIDPNLEEGDTKDYKKRGGASGADGTKYCVLSTTGSYFAGKYNNAGDGYDYWDAYVPDDYRESLSKKGYTFCGWKEDIENPGNVYYGCTPRFNDISVKAEWTPNIYNLKVHLKDNEYKRYESEFKIVDGGPGSPVTFNNVTVGSTIPAGGWPKRTDWYAYNPGATEENENDYRLLLGATFAGLDPGDSNKEPNDVYLHYAEAVTNLLNSKTVFYDEKGRDTFFLPEDEDYERDLGEATVTRGKMSNVPDYPTGSEIPMYGVYRERSLVFIEKYVDMDGVTQEKIMYSHPWSQYSDYPYNDKTGYVTEGSYAGLIRPDTNGNSYVLEGWYVGEDNLDPELKYPKPEKAEIFYEKIGKWQENAIKEGKYDIGVYTVYVAKQNIIQELAARTDTYNLFNSAPPSVSCKLPGSMREGELSYSLTPDSDKPDDFNNLHLITKEEMEEHLYDSEWQIGSEIYTANDTVAIELALIDSKGNEITENYNPDAKYLVAKDGKEQKVLTTSQHVGKGWTIALRLYHSRVMSESREYSFKINYTFFDDSKEADVSGNKRGNALSGQSLTDKVTVSLEPSVYEVTYESRIPGNPAYEIREPRKFVNGGVSYTEDVLYSGKVIEEADLPVAVYVAENDGSVPGTDPGTPNARWRGKGSWILDREKIGLNKDPAYTVLYGGTLVKDEEKDQDKLTPLEEYLKKAAENKETIGRITLYTEWEPDDTLDMYLEDGTIEIWGDSYIHYKNGNTKPAGWRGNYNILMDRYNNVGLGGEEAKAPVTTENVLILHDNLSSQKIYLGNLGITKNNSIELYEGASAKLFTAYGKKKVSSESDSRIVDISEIKIKNILVPSGSSLDLKTKVKEDKIENEGATETRKTGILELAPAVGYAAIGGENKNGKNGTIDLEKLIINMELPKDSYASGIGSGDQTIGGYDSTVTLNGCQVTVKEEDGYKGAWIGGSNVKSVVVDGTTVQDKEKKAAGGSGNASGPYVLNGETVNVTNKSTLGTTEKPLSVPIHAKYKLFITEDSKVY